MRRKGRRRVRRVRKWRCHHPTNDFLPLSMTYSDIAFDVAKPRQTSAKLHKRTKILRRWTQNLEVSALFLSVAFFESFSSQICKGNVKVRKQEERKMLRKGGIKSFGFVPRSDEVDQREWLERRERTTRRAVPCWRPPQHVLHTHLSHSPWI